MQVPMLIVGLELKLQPALQPSILLIRTAMLSQYQAAHPSGSANQSAAKLDHVTRILSELKADLDANKLSIDRMPPFQCTHATRLPTI